MGIKPQGIVSRSFWEPPGSRSYFKVYSIPVGTLVRIKNDPLKESLVGYDRMEGKITGFADGRYADIELVMKNELICVHFDNIEFSGRHLPGFPGRFYHFFKNILFHSRYRKIV